MVVSRISALGLDIGRKRVGVAGCDGMGLIATGLTTIQRRSFSYLVEALQELVDERQVQLLVVGMPYSMDGSVGPQARQTQRVAEQLSKMLNLPVEYVDERLTSYEAEQLLQADERRSPAHHKALVDRKAAAIILQQWLDQR